MATWIVKLVLICHQIFKTSIKINVWQPLRRSSKSNILILTTRTYMVSGFCFVLCQLSVVHPAKKNSLRKKDTHSSMFMCLVKVQMLKKKTKMDSNVSLTRKHWGGLWQKKWYNLLRKLENYGMQKKDFPGCPRLTKLELWCASLEVFLFAIFSNAMPT